MNALTDPVDDAVEAELPPTERRWLRWLRLFGRTLIGIYFVLALGLLALRFWLLPHVADYKPEIAAAVSRTIGERVEIGGIKAQWLGFRPQLELENVRVIDRRGQEALALPYVGVTMSWRSLIAGEPRFLSLVVDRPELLIHRDQQGRLFVAGLESKADDSSERGSAADWVLRQGEVVIRNATIEWDDESRRAVPLRLENVEFVLQNDGRHHRFALRAQPPKEFASPLDIRGDLKGRTLEQLREWDGTVYAAFDYIDVAAWRAWVDYPFEIWNGRGALRLWLGFGDGVLTDLAADVAFADVAARFARELPPIEMRTMSGQFGAKKKTAIELLDLDGEPNVSYEAFARQLVLVGKDDVALTPADFTANWAPARGRSDARGEVVAKSIELAPLAHFVEYVPIPQIFRTALVTMAPEGRISDLRFTWTGEVDAPASYAARGRFAKLGLKPYGHMPGFDHLAGTFNFTERGGTAALNGNSVTVDYPRIFIEDAIALDALSGRVDWSFPHGQLAVRFDNVAFANADAAGTASGLYQRDAKGAHGVDISARVTRADGKHVYKYIPDLPHDVADWLKRAIVAGTASDVQLRLRGDLADFPFDDPKKGEFRIFARVTGGTLDYAESWPALTDISGELLLEGRKLRITSSHANALGTQISRAVVGIPNLFHGRHEVIVDGEASGPLGEFFKYVAQSPVRGFLDGLMDNWTGEGPGRLALHMELPLGDLSGLKVAGSFQFANNRIAMGPGEPALSQVNGRVDFTQASVNARNLVAQTLGGSIAVQLSTRGSDGRPRGENTFISAVQGTVDSAQLAQLLDLPIASQLHGPMQFRHTTTRRGRQTQSVFESPLAGVAIDLPAPLAKPAGESWPLKIERTALPVDAASSGARREAVAVTLGTVLNAQAELKSEGGHTLVERAGIGIGSASAQLPDQPGVSLAVNLKSLDLDDFLPAMIDASKKSGAADFAVSAIDLRADALTVGGRRINDVALRAQFNALKLWNAQVTARELAGDITWEPEGKGAVAARLKYLVHPERAPDAAQHNDAMQDLPALAIVADRYVFNGRELGRLEVQAVNLRQAWRLDRLELAAPDGMLTASGRWEPRAGPERTELEVKADVSDVGKYLARFGYPDTIARGTATLNARLQWNGPVHRIDYSSLSGDLAIKAQKGQFVKVNPGVGKLLGVLSLQSLPRRISLDFRDVFSEGFAFDSFAGTAKIANGIATTDDLTMAGPAASVAISGRTDLANETQDLTVRVVPTVGDSIALAAGVALLNPIVGAGALLAQRLLRDPLGQMLAYEYRVSGSWEDPKVVKAGAPQRTDEFGQDQSTPLPLKK